MVFIDNIDNNPNEDFTIWLTKPNPVLVIHKFKEPILVDITELDTFVSGFQIKEELIDWICRNIEELNKEPHVLKQLITHLSKTSHLHHYAMQDGTTITELEGPLHHVEVLQDDYGSLISIKDKRNRMVAKASLYEKKIFTTAIRSKQDNMDFVFLYPKTKGKMTVTSKQIEQWNQFQWDEKTKEGGIPHNDNRLKNNLEKLKKFTELNINWDDKGALPIEKQLIQLLSGLLPDLPVQPDIFPAQTGGLFIVFHLNENRLTMELCPDNQVKWHLQKIHKETKEGLLAWDEKRIKDMIHSFFSNTP